MNSGQNTQSIAQAAQFLVHGDFTSAERIVETVLAQTADAEALHLLGLVRMQQKRLDEAVTLLAQSIAALPGQPDVLYNFGRALSLLEQHGYAAAAFSDAVRFQPDFAEAWYELGNAQRVLCQLADAEMSYHNVLRLAPGHGRARLGLGAILIDANRAAEAETLLARGLAEARDTNLAIDLIQNLAAAQLKQGKKDAALKSYVQIRHLDPGRTDFDALRVNILEELGRFDEALALMEAMLAREPDNASIHNYYNDMLYRLGREEEFLGSYDRAPMSAQLQLDKAVFLVARERIAEAHAVYAEVLAREPGNQDAASGTAATLGRLGRHDEAARLYEQALARDPDNAGLQIGLATLALRAGDPERAAALAEQALGVNPLDQYILAILGSAWRMMGDERDEALNGYDSLIRTFDLEPPEGFSSMVDFNVELGTWLDRQHPPTREYTAQSLRGGTQTKNIFSAGHDLVDRLQLRITETMNRYIADLGTDEKHPFLSRRRNGFAYSGSWSSRLRDCGFHINHVHPLGWISSCYYVALPDVVADINARQGWIKFGEPYFEIGLGIRRAIQPAPGRLVLFPSYMWHGTLPFRSEAARITIAFDAVPC